MRSTLLGVTALALPMLVASCASAPSLPAVDAAPFPEHGHIDEEGRIYYLGPLRIDANEMVMQRFDAATTKPTTLLISSSGGDVIAGMDLGDWILEYALDVEVATGCLSSCANYVFPAGATKRLHRDSVLLWHGSTWQRDFDRYLDPGDPGYAPAFWDVRQREVRFFDRIGVDNLITVYWQRQGIGWWDRVRAFFRRRPWAGWDYSIEDLERMGIRGIELVDGEWDWRTHQSNAAGDVRRVEISDDFVFTPSRFQEDLDRTAIR